MNLTYAENITPEDVETNLNFAVHQIKILR